LRRWAGGELWSLTLNGLPGRTGAHRTRKTSQHVLSEFGTGGRHGSVSRWGRLLGLRLWRGGGRGKSRFLAALGMTIYGRLRGRRGELLLGLSLCRGGRARSLTSYPSSSFRASGLSYRAVFGARDELRSFATLRMTGGGSGCRRLGLQGNAGVPTGSRRGRDL
jgi:hypothetical protein